MRIVCVIQWCVVVQLIFFVGFIAMRFVVELISSLMICSFWWCCGWQRKFKMACRFSLTLWPFSGYLRCCFAFISGIAFQVCLREFRLKLNIKFEPFSA